MAYQLAPFLMTLSDDQGWPIADIFMCNFLQHLYHRAAIFPMHNVFLIVNYPL